MRKAKGQVIRKFPFLMLLMVIVGVVVLGGCGQDQAGERPVDELIVALGSEPDSGFDPTKGWGTHAGSLLFQSTLLKRDHQMQIAGDLATDYTISSDGLEWTFHLRDDVVFSDGTPLTAEDVVYTYKTIKHGATAFDLSILQEATAVNDTTVKFALESPRSSFVNLTTQIGIVPKHAHDGKYGDQPIGSGPFLFVQWDKGQQLIVKPNPDYYGRKPHFNQITFLYLNEEAAFTAAKAGKVDIAVVSPSLAKRHVQENLDRREQVEELGTQKDGNLNKPAERNQSGSRQVTGEQSPFQSKVDGMELHAFKTVDNRGIAFPYVPAGGVTSSGHPVGNDVTADAAIRKAINVSVDRQMLVEGVLEGYGSPAYTVNDGLPWWNPDSVIPDGDMETAAQILGKAGWQDTDGDGILEKMALKAQFTLIYPANDRLRQSLAIAVADGVKPLGIDIKVEGKSWDEIGRLMYSNAVMMGWGAHDPLEMYNIYSSSTQGFDYFNINYYANAQVDHYLEQALAADQEDEANKFWRLAQWDGTTGLSARGDAPWAWLVNVDHLYFIREGLQVGQQKIHPHGTGWPLTDTIVEWKWAE